MSKHKKLIERFKSGPRDFTYKELRTLLTGLGYHEVTKGKTSGSRVAFIHATTKHVIRLHKPHPKNILKPYQVDLILHELIALGVLP